MKKIRLLVVEYGDVKPPENADRHAADVIIEECMNTPGYYKITKSRYDYEFPVAGYITIN